MDAEEKQRNYERAERLLDEQQFGIAVVSGVVTMILGAGFYSVATIATGGSSGSIMFVGIGAAMGLVIQYLGRGITTKFAVVASVLALFGCFLAKLFTIALYTVKSEQIPPVELLGGERLEAMLDWVLKPNDNLAV